MPVDRNNNSPRKAAVQPRPLISAQDIAARVTALGSEIAARLPQGALTAVGILRGAFVFMADLVRVIPRDVQLRSCHRDLRRCPDHK
jgi:hypoxanthine-guanine phosphoribosyltransferase